MRRALTVLLALVGLAGAAHAQALDKVRFGTNWVAEGEHGGFYQALADGTYKKYGLDVEIVPGGPNVNNRILLPVGKLDFFMSMVCPGFDDTGVWGWGGGPRKSKGYGLDVLKWTTDQALDHDPELVQLVTWNDFNEATCFEPTVEHGYQFLDALETWWGKRTGRPVDLQDNRAPFETYKKECSDVERRELPQ